MGSLKHGEKEKKPKKQKIENVEWGTRKTTGKWEKGKAKIIATAIGFVIAALIFRLLQ